MNQAKPNNKSTQEQINSVGTRNISLFDPLKKRSRSIKQETQAMEIEKNIPYKKENQKKGSQAILSEYEKREAHFISYGFSQSCDLFLRKISCDSSSSLSKLAAKYPLLKILKTVVKKLMLNEFEMLYWACFLECNKWEYSWLSNYPHIGEFPDLLTSSEYSSQNEYKALLLYLCLAAFAIKKYLNEEEETEIFEAYLKNIWPFFLELYPHFSDRCGSILPLKAAHLNFIHKKFSNIEKLVEDSNQYYDYNSLVDDIIHISPPYNYDRYENINQPNSLETHGLANQPFIHKMEKTASFNLPPELPKLGRESSITPLNQLNLMNGISNDFPRLPQLLKKESGFPELFRGDSFFQDNLLMRNDSFGLENLSFNLVRNSSMQSEFENNMKLEEKDINYNKNLLNIPPFVGQNSDIEINKNDGDPKKNKEGFKLTKNSMHNNNNNNGNSLFQRNSSNIQQD